MAVEGNGQRLRFNRIESDECNEQRLKKNVGVEWGAGTSYIISSFSCFCCPHYDIEFVLWTVQFIYLFITSVTYSISDGRGVIGMTILI